MAAAGTVIGGGRPGRPRKPPEERLSVNFFIRLKPGEADLLFQVARRAGISAHRYVQALVRRVLAEGPKTVGEDALKVANERLAAKLISHNTKPPEPSGA